MGLPRVISQQLWLLVEQKQAAFIGRSFSVDFDILIAPRSCKDIRGSLDSIGDGEYWIDPENSCKPIKVFCDMTTEGGKLSMETTHSQESDYSFVLQLLNQGEFSFH